MKKNLFAFIFLFLTGCFLLVEPSDNTTSYGGTYHTDLWIDFVSVDCAYNPHWDEAIWYLDVYLDSSYTYYEDEVTVGVYIDGWDYYALYPHGYGTWGQILESYWYECGDATAFDFVVSDIYGNSDEITVWW